MHMPHPLASFRSLASSLALALALVLLLLAPPATLAAPDPGAISHARLPTSPPLVEQLPASGSVYARSESAQHVYYPEHMRMVHDWR